MEEVKCMSCAPENRMVDHRPIRSRLHDFISAVMSLHASAAVPPGLYVVHTLCLVVDIVKWCCWKVLVQIELNFFMSSYRPTS